MAAPKTNITQQDGQLGASSPSGRRPVIVAGASTTGPTAGDDLTALVAYQNATTMANLYGKGPLVEQCKYHIARGTAVIPIRLLADQTGSCGAIDNTGMAGTCDASFPSTPTPPRSAEVVIKFPIGGEVGTGPIYYQISLDGGATWDGLHALGTGHDIEITALDDLAVQLSTGAEVKTIANNDYFAFSCTVVNAGTCVYTLCSTNELTSAVSASGTPDDGYEILITFVNGGTTGVAGITYTVSLDDGRGSTSAIYALSTATTITVAGTGGVVVDLGSSTVVATGSTIRVTTGAPGWDSTALDDGLDMVPDYKGDWEQFHLVGACDTTSFAAVDDLMNSLPDTKAKDRFATVSFRARTVGSESEAQYQTAVGVWRASCTSVLGYTGYTAGTLQCVTSGISYRREVGFAYGAKVASVAEQINVAQRQAPGGPLVACSLGVAQDGVPDHDEYNSPGLDDLQAVTARSWTDVTGVYITWPWTAAAAGSDFGVVTRRRIMNLGLTAARTYCANLTAKDLYINATTGFLEPFERDRLSKGATAAAERAEKGKASAVQVLFAPDDNLLTNPPSPLNCTLNLIPKGEVHDVNLLARFAATLQQ